MRQRPLEGTRGMASDSNAEGGPFLRVTPASVHLSLLRGHHLLNVFARSRLPRLTPRVARHKLPSMEGEVLKGHLDMIVLAALAGRPAHGYAVIQEINRRSGGTFDLPEGTIEIALPGGVSVRVDAQVDSGALRRVLAALVRR